jgi:hypothetical protein
LPRLLPALSIVNHCVWLCCPQQLF